MLQTPPKPLTLAEFIKLPETKPVSEYIDGQIIQKPMPQGEHSTIQGELIISINATVKPKKIARAFPELRCTFGGKSIVSIVPDVAIFTWERIPRQENGRIANVFEIAPDWIIEILSPDQSATKVIKKILRSLQFETKMGWLIDPDEQTVFAYLPQQQPQVFDQPHDLLPVPTFASEFQLTLGDLFAWLLE